MNRSVLLFWEALLVGAFASIAAAGCSAGELSSDGSRGTLDASVPTDRDGGQAPDGSLDGGLPGIDGGTIGGGAIKGTGTTYYLDPAHGNDSNPGTQESPWKTLGKIAESVGPGDTVNILGGTYTPSQYTDDGTWEVWKDTQAHGTAGNPIVIQANPGETVIFDGQRQPVWMNFNAARTNQSFPFYVVVQNLEFQHYSPSTVSVGGASHVAVLNCYFHDTYDSTASVVGTIDADHVIFRGNRFYNVGDPSVYGMQGSPGDHAIYLSDNSSYIVVDKNYTEKVWNHAIHGWGNHGVPTSGSHWILRQNTLIDSRATPILVTGSDYANIYVYNNTIYNHDVGLFTYVDNSATQGAVIFHLASTYSGPVVVKNNIGHGYYDTAPFYADNEITSDSVLVLDYNMWNNLSSSTKIYSWAGSSYELMGFRAATGLEEHALSDDPRFANISGRDFTLQSMSPAIDAGTFLTTTTGSGSGMTLVVADAGFFTDGFGLVAGDMIQVGSNGPVQVTAIDYESNTMTVAQSISWTDGQGVSLPYSGARPDLGAHE